jgi:homoserine kinase type II
MALFTPLAPADLAAAAAAFGLPPPDRVEPEPRGRINTSYHLWSGGERWFLRIAEGKGEADVAFEAEIQRFLFAAHFPVPALRTALDGRLLATVAGKPALLFHYAPGEEKAAADVTPAHCLRVGEQLGRLHDLSAAITLERPNPYGPAIVQAWVAALGDGDGADGAPALEPEARAALPLFREEAAAASHLPGAPRGLVHADLFRDNVLWLGDRIGYLLDWEMACTDAFALDLATAVDAWCYGEAHDHLRAVALLQGYRSRRKLEPGTADALHAHARFSALRFALGRLRTFPAGRPDGAAVVWKDWRRYRDRLVALRAMGPAGYRALLGL